MSNSQDVVDFPRNDVHVLDGNVDGAGGTVKMTSANGTFDATTVRFSAQWHVSGHYDYRNISTSQPRSTYKLLKESLNLLSFSLL